MPETPMIELSSDLESQKSSLLSSYLGQSNDVKQNSSEIYLTVKDLAHKSTSILTLDGAVKPSQRSTQTSFLVWTIINTLATIGIVNTPSFHNPQSLKINSLLFFMVTAKTPYQVFTNKMIFDDPSFKSMQTSFAAFHFFCTSITLFIISRPALAFFVPNRCGFVDILPLALAMCFNVILPNLSLAYSSITFYQIVRILLTPLVAFINLVFYGISIPRPAAMSLIPVCLGVAIVSYYDTRGSQDLDANVTTIAGVIFAFTGVIASSLYTVWIGTYHRKLNMSSMQLLFNQAPVSSLLLLFFIPIADTIPVFRDVPINRWLMIGISGVFASLINLSQFFIIAGAGAVSSTVVGHGKTCSIVILGWMYSGRSISDKSLLGILLAIGGIMLYSIAIIKTRR